MKAAIWVLIGFGLLLLMASNFFGITPGLLGLAMIAGGLFLGLRPGGILRKESTIDTWGALLDEACVDDGHERADKQIICTVKSRSSLTLPRPQISR
jgi:hypothetical protein